MKALNVQWPLFGLCVLLAALVIGTRVLWTMVKRDEVDNG